MKKVFITIAASIIVVSGLTSCSAEQVYQKAAADVIEPSVTSTPSPSVTPSAWPYGTVQMNPTTFHVRCWDGEPCIAEFPGYSQDCLAPELVDEEGRKPNSVEIVYTDDTFSTVSVEMCTWHYDGSFENLTTP